MALKIILIILGSIILLLATIILIGITNPKRPLDPSDYKWAQVDKFNPDATADSLLQEMSLDEKMDQLRGGGLAPSIRMGVRFVLFKHSKQLIKMGLEVY